MLDLLRIEPTLVTDLEGKKYAALYYVKSDSAAKVTWYIAVEANDKNEYKSGTPCYLIAAKDPTS